MGIVDDRRCGPCDQANGGLKCRPAKVSVADRIEDQLMFRQSRARIEMIGDHDAREIGAVVEERRGRDIAAARGDQLQQAHRRNRAAIGQGRDRMVAKAAAEMSLRAGPIAEIRQHGAEPLMRRRIIRIELQCRFIVPARLVVPVGAQEQVGEIDMRHRICRMVQDRLGINAAGGIDRARLGEQGSELVQRAEMRRRPP